MKPVRTETDRGIATIVMDDGHVNAVDLELCRGMRAALSDSLSADVVVLCGRPGYLSVGLDLKYLRGLAGDGAMEFVETLEALLFDLLTYPRPIVVACTGHAVGAGALMLAAGDVRVGTPHGRVGVTGLRLGLTFPSSGIELVRRLMGAGNAMRWMMASRIAEGDERVQSGWLDRTVADDELLADAQEAAARLGQLPTEALQLTRQRGARESVKRIKQHRRWDVELLASRLQDPEVRRRIEKLL